MAVIVNLTEALEEDKEMMKQWANQEEDTYSQSISGTKTFSTSPAVPNPTSASDAASKEYVDMSNSTTKWVFTEIATAGQTDFVADELVAGVSVFVNGVLLTLTTDYTESDYTISLVSPATVGDTINIIGGAPYDAVYYSVVVDNIADMLALTPSSDDVCFVKGYYAPSDGGDGTFIYDSARSAENDGGTIIGGWVRQGTNLSVKNFGALGDGVTDDTLAFQDAADYAVSVSIAENRVVSLFIPSGDYILNTQIVFDVDKGAGNRGVYLYGEGMNTSRLIATAGNTTGLIKFTSSGNLELWEVRDVGFLSQLDYDAATNNGDALYIDSTIANLGAQPNRSVSIENVYIGTYGDSIGDINGKAIGNFLNGIVVKAKWFPLFRNIYIQGSLDQTLSATETHHGRQHAIICDYCFSPEFYTIYIAGFWEYGVLLNQDKQEDFRFQDSFLVNQIHGFTVIHDESIYSDTTEPYTYHADPAKLYEPGGAISNCHINCHTNGIHIKYHRQVNISGCYIYVPRGDKENQDQTGLPSGIFLEGTSDTLVSQNQLLETGFYVDDSNTAVGIKCTHRAEGVSLSENHFNHGGVGVYVGDFGIYTDVVHIKGSTLGGRTVGWSLEKLLLDISQLSIVSDTWELDGEFSKFKVTETAFKTIEAPIKEVIYSNRDDYATESDINIFEHLVKANTSTGAEGIITTVYDMPNNDFVNTTYGVTTYFKTSSGNHQVAKLSTPTITNDTAYILSYFDGADIVTRRVSVGAADSGGTGYKLLRIVN